MQPKHPLYRDGPGSGFGIPRVTEIASNPL